MAGSRISVCGAGKWWQNGAEREKKKTKQCCLVDCDGHVAGELLSPSSLASDFAAEMGVVSLFVVFRWLLIQPQTFGPPLFFRNFKGPRWVNLGRR